MAFKENKDSLSLDKGAADKETVEQYGENVPEQLSSRIAELEAELS